MEFGRLFIFIGIIFVVIGLIWSVIGKLPGDITVKKGNFTFFFPIMTSIVVSIILSLVFYFIGKMK
ncbi:DUF2905 domain-containing protein [Salirhabdus salicampi]|uniref:DUF2905 domain-containing protein n=1 Tax=Salirhabdus salicampi TaxID=476102 RepID=UPI0020C47032|nr:DUF2905 domain-containing protein [Salirhabdus salicampi]MCP8616990.1 DUF2905 domain-containing protein [Salirhabdus salicampi]